MNFKKKINISLSFLIKQVILLMIVMNSNFAMALGLGEIKVYSYLNEPLNAEIVVTGIEDLDTSNIIAELASPKDFMRTGIPRPFFLTKLKFETKRNEGVTVIHLSTTQAIKNPFLDFLVQLVWPDGKIIKNYTVLLDPQMDNSIKKDLKVTDKKELSLQENINKNNIDLQVDKNLKLTEQLRADVNSDAIFATSLEESVTNEALLKRENKRSAVHHSIVAEIDHPSAMSVTIEPDEPSIKHDYHPDPVHVNNDYNSVLGKVVSSLQVFAEHSNRPKINYAKLFDLKPNTIPVHKEGEQIVESMAIADINSELNSLRYSTSPDVTANKISSIVKEIDLSKQPVSNNVSNASSLELITKHGNDLLWACCLVSAIIFLFHKMITSSHQPTDSLVLQEQAANFLQQQERPIVFNHFTTNTPSNNANNMGNNNALSDLNINNLNQQSQDELNTLLKQSSVNSDYNDFSMLKNEELELKIALAKQYLEAGNKKSAKDILQEITIVKEQKYQDQIASLLRSIV